MEIYRQLDDSVGTAICLAAQAAALIQLSRAEEAVQILSQPEVTEQISPDSLHHALILGDLGTAYCQLGRWEDARPLLQQSLDHLDQLGIGQSAERLLYVVELTHVLDRLGDARAAETRQAATELVDHWCKQPSRRQRVEKAISQFKS